MAYRKQENPRTAACKAPSRAGFTLAELLVVVSVLIVLFGLGVGAFLKLKGPYAFKAQVALVRTTIRKARNYALTQGTGAKVVVDPYANEVRACGVLTSGHWSFDNDSDDALVTQGAYGHDGILSGTSLVEGRFGGAYDFPSGSGAYIECGDQGSGIWDDVTGIQFICWIKPVDFKTLIPVDDDGNRGSDPGLLPDSDLPVHVILEKGSVYSLALVEDYSIEIIVGDVAVSGRIRSRPGVVFPNRWNKIEVTFDGRVENPLYRIQISTNGIECFELYTFHPSTDEKVIFRTQEGSTFIEDDEILEQLIPKRVPRTEELLTISCDDTNAAFVGAIDEVSIGVVVSDTIATLREARLMGYRQEIYFDKRGRLDAAYHSGPVIIEITNDPHYRPDPPPEEDDGFDPEEPEDDGMGVGPTIPRRTAVPAVNPGGAGIGVTGPRTVPKIPKKRKTKGAIIKRIVVELSGNTTSRAVEYPAHPEDED
ncbi:MAG: hypothetical protein E3J72_14865 [Planctomycetota bacterium]|nr:MAG: hypothetical protein E3J72_14865 [Planctomycetota bacterium]